MDIKLLQQKLNSFDYISPKLEVDGLLGPSTLKAIKKFQKENLLVPDGKIGPLSLSALNLPNSSPILQGKYDVQPLPKDISFSLTELSLQIALSQLGVRELSGHNDGPAVESFLRSIGLGKGFSWCGAFVYWCVNEAAKVLNLPNPLVKTGGVLYQWQYTKCKKVLSNPQRGDIFIIDHGRGLGHTGRVVDVVGSKIITIEGNANNNGSREGVGIFKLEREQSTIKGYIRI